MRVQIGGDDQFGLTAGVIAEIVCHAARELGNVALRAIQGLAGGPEHVSHVPHHFVHARGRMLAATQQVDASLVELRSGTPHHRF